MMKTGINGRLISLIIYIINYLFGVFMYYNNQQSRAPYQPAELRQPQMPQRMPTAGFNSSQPVSEPQPLPYPGTMQQQQPQMPQPTLGQAMQRPGNMQQQPQPMQQYAKGGVARSKKMVIAHFNPRELDVLDHLQGSRKECGKTGVRSYSHLEEIFKNPHILNNIHTSVQKHHAHKQLEDHVNPNTGHPEYWNIGPTLSSLGNSLGTLAGNAYSGLKKMGSDIYNSFNNSPLGDEFWKHPDVRSANDIYNTGKDIYRGTQSVLNPQPGEWANIGRNVIRPFYANGQRPRYAKGGSTHTHYGTPELEHLAAGGRHGDTELALIGPHTQHLFNQLAGRTTRNPNTGHPEYFSLPIGSMLSSLGGGLSSLASSAGTGLANGIYHGGTALGNAALSGMQGIANGVDTARNMASGLGNSLYGMGNNTAQNAMGGMRRIGNAATAVPNTLTERIGSYVGGGAGGLAGGLGGQSLGGMAGSTLGAYTGIPGMETMGGIAGRALGGMAGGYGGRSLGSGLGTTAAPYVAATIQPALAQAGQYATNAANNVLPGLGDAAGAALGGQGLGNAARGIGAAGLAGLGGMAARRGFNAISPTLGGIARGAAVGSLYPIGVGVNAGIKGKKQRNQHQEQEYHG